MTGGHRATSRTTLHPDHRASSEPEKDPGAIPRRGAAAPSRVPTQAPTLSTVSPVGHQASPQSPATAEGLPYPQAPPPPSPYLSSFSWSRSSRAPSSRSSRCRARSSPQSSSARPCPAGARQAVSPRAQPPKTPTSGQPLSPGRPALGRHWHLRTPPGMLWARKRCPITTQEALCTSHRQLGHSQSENRSCRNLTWSHVAFTNTTHYLRVSKAHSGWGWYRRQGGQGGGKPQPKTVAAGQKTARPRSQAISCHTEVPTQFCLL